MTKIVIPTPAVGGATRLKAALLLSACAALFPSVLHAQDNFVVEAGSTATSTFQLDGSDTLTVQEGATLSVESLRAVNFNGEPSGAGPVIDNAGIIESMVNPNGYAIDAQPAVTTASKNITIRNRATGILRANSDTIRIGQDTDVTAPTLITVENSGRITSLTGAAIRINDIVSARLSVTNEAGGHIEGAQRGINAIVGDVTNAGTITGGQDAIRFMGPGDSSVTLLAGSTTSATGLTPEANAVAFVREGRHVLTVEVGANVIGRLKGSVESSEDILNLRGTGSQQMVDIVDFDVMNLQSGSWEFANAVSLAGGATISEGGTLRLIDGATTSGAIHGVIVNNGEIVFARSGELSQDGPAIEDGNLPHSSISGTGSVRLANSAGTVVFTQANTYSGSTLIDAGILRTAGANTLSAASAVTVGSDGTLDLNGFDNQIANLSGAGSVLTGGTSTARGTLTVGSGGGQTEFSGVLSGHGGLTKIGSGRLLLSGSNSTTGLVQVTGGTLMLTGSLAGTAGASGTGRLSGTGTVAGVTNIGAGGTLAPGVDGVGTFTTGGLVLDSGASLAFDLGAADDPAASDRIQVNGNLTLDGTINVTNAGGFGVGVYRLIDYTGILTDNGLTIGGLPVGFLAEDAEVQTSVDKQVNLAVFGDSDLQFWDGGNSAGNDLVDGGSGSWTSDATNWTDLTGAINRDWTSNFAIFQGQAGTVTVDDEIVFTGLQFMTDGYVIADGTGSLATGTATTNIRVDPDVTATIAESIGGTGRIVKLDSGTLVLSGVNGYTGGTGVNGGVLAVTGSLMGAVDVSASGTLAGTGTVAGTIAIGAGGTLAPGMNGVGTFTTGGLVLDSGARLAFDLGTPGDAAASDRIQVNGDLTLDGTLDVANAGGFGAGVYRLIDYTGALTDNGLIIGGMPTGFLAEDAEVQTSVDNQVNLVVASVISDLQFWDGNAETSNGAINGGSGSWVNGTTNWTDQTGARNMAWGSKFAIFQGPAGTVTVDDEIVFTGLQFMTDGYVIADGTGSLAVGAEQTNIRVDPRVTATIAESIGGAGGIVKLDGGTLILSGTNSYAGGTIIEGGILRTASAAALPETGDVTILQGALLDIGGDQRIHGLSGDGEVTLSGGSLTAGSDSDMTFGGRISGAGGFTKLGAGTMTLSGENSFTGGTLVEAGALAVTGSLASAVSVMEGARLLGGGRIGELRISGTVAPGNSIGVLEVGGAVTFEPGSILEIELSPTEADRITAAGPVTINGGTVSVLAATGAYAPRTVYTIISGAAVSGAFDEVSSNLAFLQPHLTYTPDAVTLTLLRNDVDFTSVANTRNTFSVAAAIENLGTGNALYEALVVLDEGSANSAFDRLSGEAHGSVQTALIANSRMMREASLERLAAVSLHGGNEPGGAMWASGFVSGGPFKSDGNAARMNQSAEGMMIGGDAALTQSVRAGIVAGYSQTDLAFDARVSRADIESWHLGLYAGGEFGPVRIGVGAAYSRNSVELVRDIAGWGLNQSLSSSYDTDTMQVFGEVGHRLGGEDFGIEPFAGLAYVRLNGDEFAESGGAAALSSAESDMDSLMSSLGVNLAANLRSRAKLDLRAAWQHSFGDIVPLSSLRFANSDSFDIAGVSLARDAALLKAGLTFGLGRNAQVGVSYSGQLAQRVSDHSGRFTLTVGF